MIRFSKSNWARFDTHGKVTTIRTKPTKLGVHAAMGGPRFKPERLGDVEALKEIDLDGGVWREFQRSLKIEELTDQNAINDGFSSRDELLMELARLNKDLTPDSIVWINPIKKVA